MTGLITDQQGSSALDSQDEASLSDLGDENEIRIERDENQNGLAEGVFPIDDIVDDVEESIRVERADGPEIGVEEEASFEEGEEIRIERRRRTDKFPSPGGVAEPKPGSESETLAEVEENGDEDDSIATQTIRVEVEKRDLSKEQQADPLITPGPSFQLSSPGRQQTDYKSLDGGMDAGANDHNAIRVQKRETWTTPDYLTSIFPLFITLACSCLVSSAAPGVTSSVTEVREMWSFESTTSTKSEVYRFTEHPSWSTVYRTVA
ncbi:hypothetical protein ONS95_005295 [Cadophora gregata]|uniref:uncharacterized protein n=1 Tax=Cadophora gregata TaxID=51156 RepID=UPI0026DB951E|nr:uncharacterized protein ONS95_005295 [Cadophora gregata]KAK0103261.1 hypothetical protein ONS95_005295 [Cadophora gregata]